MRENILLTRVNIQLTPVKMMLTGVEIMLTRVKRVLAAINTALTRVEKRLTRVKTMLTPVKTMLSPVENASTRGGGCAAVDPARRPATILVMHISPTIVTVGLLALAACSGPVPASQPQQTQEIHPHTINRPEPIFNGIDLSGWWGADTENPAVWQALEPEALAAKKAASLGNIRSHWRVEDGELVNDGQGLFLTTEKEYEDFELTLEYRTVAGADSGIYLKGYPQVQIWDSTEAGGKWHLGADKGSGGLWNNSAGKPGKEPLVLADAPFGQWNTLVITMIGERVSVLLNGHLVVDHARLENYFDRSKALVRRGPIQLQTHGGEIRFRNLAVREIGAHEANRVLLAGGITRHGDLMDTAWMSVFDGLTFAGWAGDTDSYEIVDRTIRCREGRGGTVYFDHELGDCEARFEFLLPPGGNNGLAIRYPGSGDTAYVGMCEIQILDDTHPKYANLDPRQYCGSIYGMVAAQRGFLRETGQWNAAIVRVVGSRIAVEVNGTVIVDADVAAVTEAMGPIEKFAGRTREKGFFGFAGHGDAVAYRNLMIRELGDE